MVLDKLKGTLAEQVYKHFNRLPGQGIQQALRKEGWEFQTITGSGGEGTSDHLHVVIHPDGKPLDGLGSPGYFSGSDGPLIDPKQKPVIEQRFKDFSAAVARAKPKP